MLAILALGVALGPSCNSDTRPPGYRTGTTTEPKDKDAGNLIPIDSHDASTPPPPDAAGYCGNQILPLVTTRKNLYLVLDRSGSMQDPIRDPTSGVAIKKYDAAIKAIRDVLFALGHRLNYGAAVLPRFGVIDTCDPGAEVYPMTPGDSVTAALSGKDGEHLTNLVKVLAAYKPEGPTPTSATLGLLVEPLIALGSDTSVILATDGAPNCNDSATCDIAHCIPNIEGWWLTEDIKCGSTINCCDSILTGGGNCVDTDATAAPIEQLRANGIKTYVVGLPGSEVYADVLSRLALAGGTARAQTVATDPVYYPVADAAELTASLKGITASLAISCTIALDDAPPDWTQVNVYFDGTLVKMNVDNGWTQVDANTIEITGSYCDVLKSGDVFQVQVVAGCPTQVLI